MIFAATIVDIFASASIASLTFYRCSASISLQPWRYEKKEPKHLLHQVGGNTSTVSDINRELMSTASCDVCHIEGNIKARAESLVRQVSLSCFYLIDSKTKSMKEKHSQSC